LTRGILAWALAACAGAAGAANLSVTTLVDGGAGSLRAALATAGGNGQADVITFAVTGTISLGSTIQLGADGGFLTDVQGPGAAQLVVSGGGAVQILSVPTGASLRLADLTLAAGLAAGADGAAGERYLGGGGGGGGGMGGAIFVAGGAVTLDGVALQGNVARGGDGGWGADRDTTQSANGNRGGAGGSSSQGLAGGGSVNSDGAGGSGGGGGAGIAGGGVGVAGNAGGGGGSGGSALGTLSGGSGGSGGGCGGGSGFSAGPGDFGGRGGRTSGGVIGNQNCVTGAGGGGGAGLGGGIAIVAGTLTLTDVVFSGNQADGGDRGFAFDGAETSTPANDGLGKGGGLFVDSAATVVATNVTFVGNAASDDVGSCVDNDDFYTRGTFPQDAPTDLALSAATVAENQPAGTAVGNLTTTDASPVDAFTYALVAGAGSTHNAQFQIVGAQLRSAAVLDFEAGAARSVRIRTTDACGQPYEEAFAIAVTNVNEAPTVAAAAFSIAENSPNGSAVGTVTASDPDAGSSFTWTIQSGNAGGAFAIGAGGQITVANGAALDFETTPSFPLVVRATDSGAPAAFDEETVTVTLTDVNEAPTVAAAAFSIAENSPNGSAVGTVTASDPDAGSSFTWTIQSGNAGGAFAIGAGGQITVANGAALDFETTPSFPLVVRATDNGAPALFDEETVAVGVIDVEEPVTAVADARSTDEDTPLIEADPGLVGNDVDPDGLAIAVSAFDATSALGASIAVAPGGGFTYDPRPSATLQALRAGESLDDTFSYTAADAGGTSAVATVTVTVNGVDAGLVLSKQALVGGIVPVGSSFAFRLTVLNEGPGVATGVLVEDPLPALLGFVSSDCASHAGGLVTWAVGSLAAGAEASCDVVVQGLGAGPATNTATVSADDTDPEVDPVTASATVQIGLLQEIPALGPGGLALLALALASAGLAATRRRR